MTKRTVAKLPVVLALIVIAALLVYGYWPEPVDVDVAEVVRGSLEVTVNDDGETRIREKYVVTTPVAGKLLRVDLHAGDIVQQDVTELARIEPNDPRLLDARTQAECEARLKAAEAAVQQSEAARESAVEALEIAEHRYSRAETLVSEKAVSRSEFDAAEHGRRIAKANLRSAEFGVRVARFELEHARAAASRYDADGKVTSRDPFRLVAPINGRVLRVFLEDAGVVTPTTAILELGDPQDLEIEIDVLSSEAVRIEPGDLVHVEHWGGDETLHGVVRVVEPSAFLKISALGVEEKRVNVIADFVDPWSRRQSLGDGFRIEARIVIDTSSEESLKVPASALFRDGGTWKVYRVVNDHAKLCSVDIGLTNGLETEIKKGLSKGDVIVLHPSDKLRDGVRTTQ